MTNEARITHQKQIIYERKEKAVKHQGSCRVLRFQALLLPQADDAENDSHVQAYGQVVFLQAGGSRRIPHRRAHLLAGRDRGGSQPLHHQPQIDNTSYQPFN